MDSFFRFIFLSLGLPQLVGLTLMRDPVIRQNMKKMREIYKEVAERTKYYEKHPIQHYDNTNPATLAALDKIDRISRAKHSRSR